MNVSQHIVKPALFALSTLTIAMLSNKVSAHGFMEFPQDYAQSCAVGTTTDLALCNEKVKAQKNEINQGDVGGNHKGVLLDGQLCSASKGGDYSVLDKPSPNRHTNQLVRDKDGKVTIKYNVTAKHATWYWDYFVTRDGFNPDTDPLTWADLERITVIDGKNQEPLQGINEQKIDWPVDKTGKRILFQIWQRPMVGSTPHEVLGESTGWNSREAFYSCANINVVDEDGGTTPPEPEGAWPYSEAFAAGNTSVGIGYTVVARIMDEKGTEQFFVPLEINAANIQESRWKIELAEKINQDPSVSKFAQVGVKNDNDEIELDSNPSVNAIYYKKANWSHLIESKSNVQPDIKFDYTWHDHQSVYKFKPGSKLNIPFNVMVDEKARLQGKNYTYDALLTKIGEAIPSDRISGMVTSNGSNTGVVSDFFTVPTEGTYKITTQIKQGNTNVVTKYYHSEVIIDNEQPEVGEFDYVFPNGLENYVGGTKVQAKDGHIYQCKTGVVSGYCKQWKPSANAFEPGVGHAWEMAWDRVN